MGSTMHMHGTHADSEGGPFDMGYRQDHSMLLGRAGSDPTLGFAANMSRERQHSLVSTAARPDVLPRGCQDFDACQVRGSFQMLTTAAGEGGHRSAALAMNLPDQRMHQEILCNGLVLPGMPQQPMQTHLQYQHASLDSSLAASMAHLGLGQGSLMDDLQGANWQVKTCLLNSEAHTHCPEPFRCDGPACLCCVTV